MKCLRTKKTDFQRLTFLAHFSCIAATCVDQTQTTDNLYVYLLVRTFETFEKRSKIAPMQQNHSIKIQYFLCSATVRIYTYVYIRSVALRKMFFHAVPCYVYIRTNIYVMWRCAIKFFAQRQTTNIYVVYFYY